MDICLALGGGGSRGYAHIGVLRFLEEKGFRINAIAGTSAGGIIAVAFAAGYSPGKMEEIFSRVDQSKLFSRSSQEGPGILGLSGAARYLEELLGDKTFADLRIPCAVTAVDISTGTEVWLRQGKLVDAILATVAVPGVFPPRQIGEMQLVDGAVLNPVPVSVARALAPKLPVVAVILNGMSGPQMGIKSIPLHVPVPAPIIERLTRTRIAQAFNIFLHSVDIGSRMISELRLLNDKPDVVVRPMLQGVGLLDKVDVGMVISKGEDAAREVLPEIIKATSWSNRLKRGFKNR